MARQEPFRALLEKAMQAEAPTPRRRLPVASPALAIDDEHHRPTLEQRLDAAVLAAGATPPRGLKPAKSKALVPLRLDAPTSPERVRDGVDSVAPAPRMLQFLLEDAARTAAEDSVSRIPRLEPVVDSASLPVAFGVQTNVYRLDSVLGEELPNRPLPLVDDELITVVGRPVTKVLTVVGDHDINVASFVFDDEDLDRTDEGGHIDRAPHAPAAVALRALSDEGDGDFGDADAAADVDISDAHLDELARQLGLSGVVTRGVVHLVHDDIEGVDLSALASALDEPAENSDTSGEAFAAFAELNDGIADDDEDAIDEVEIPSALKATDPMRVVRSVVRAVPTIIVASDEDDDDDFDAFDAFADDEPSNAARLPSSLFDEPAVRPSLDAPSAVQFVVSAAPSRPRTASLSDEEIARNQQRAHDLYLVALDDIACKDTDSAIVHLQLALAYDDDTSLYGDLLAQLEKKQQPRKRAS